MYERHLPVARLRRYVDCIWVQEAGDEVAGHDGSPTHVLPTGTPEILLHFRDPFERLHEGTAAREPLFSFSGQRTRSIRVRATGRTGIILVRFHPWGASAFMRPPIDSLRDRTIDMADLAGAHPAARLRQRVLDAGDNSRRVALVQEFLLRRIDESRLDPLVIRCVMDLKRRGCAEPIGTIAARAGLSRRHLGRRFRAGIGMPPKRFSALLRFQEAIGLRREGASWAAVAQACGLHDQAHLIRLWRTFLEEPPARAMDVRPETTLGRFFRAGRWRSHFYNTTYL